MKKLLTILGVAALGMGLAAQAQVQPTLRPGVAERASKIVHRQVAELPSVQTVTVPQFTQSGKKMDTIWYYPEYTSKECHGYTYYLRWGAGEDNGFYGDESMWHGLGTNLSGSGESGSVFFTRGNVYERYSGHKLANYVVVGAVARAYRQGAWIGWEKHGFPTEYGEMYSRTTAGEDGLEYPDLPYVVKGYSKVSEQPTVTQFLQDNYNPLYVTMPESIQDAVVSDVAYLPMGDSWTNSANEKLPNMHWHGGLFKTPMAADQDYAVSFEAQLTGDAKYDSLWNYAIGVKAPDDCGMNDEYVAWIRIDMSNPNGFNMFSFNTPTGAFDVSKPMPDGFALEGNTQHDNDSSLFIYAWSWFGANKKYYPAIYGIVQQGKVANEDNADAYAQTVSVYPTPATETVNFVTIDPMQRIEIYNMAGALLKHLTLNTNVAEMDVTGMVPGTYVARIITEKGVVSKKLMVR